MNTNYIIGIVVILAIIVLGGVFIIQNDSEEEVEESGDTVVSTEETAVEEKDTSTQSSRSSDTVEQKDETITEEGETTPPLTPTLEEKLKSEPVTEEELAAPQQITVVYTNSGFNPVSITIKQGQTVTWVNENSRSVWVASAFHPTHTVYPEKKASDCLGSTFDACRGTSAGESWSFTFESAGTWRYHDHLRIGNTGVVVVK